MARLTPFAVPDAQGPVIDIGTRQGHNFAAERAEPGRNVFEAVTAHVQALQGAGKRAIIALWSEGARERMSHVLRDHGLANLSPVASWQDTLALPRPQIALAVLGLESGFETADAAVIGEQDILGDRLVRPRRAAKRADNFIAEVTALSAGDLVVHVDHGIGRFVGLRAIEAAGAPHDCLEIHYAGGDKLYLPVENIELLSRYGSEESDVDLDRLGGGAWQTRKARMRSRIREIANDLIKIAAERQLREAPKLTVEPGPFDEFCAGFPYEETEDQQAAIDVVVSELASGRPMDRLICGDVGFGKTEVALRAAFVAAMSGKQVAVVVPTTLLARQHTKTFTERFRGFPIEIAQASRLVSSAELAKAKKGLADGTVDIVVGTHALLGKGIKFKDLGLLIVDEEQHFGVAHKEKLKQLRAEVHVLTLTATPIPRTLQLALVRRARPLDHRLAAGRPARGAHLRLAVRSGGGARGAVARALPRRAGVLRLPAHRGSRGRQGFPRQARAGDEGRGRARPDAADRAGRHHVGVLRRQVRHAAVDHDHRIRPRHPDRQYADRASRRPLRALAALSIARPGRALEAARLCAVHAAGRSARSPRRPSGGSRCCNRSTRSARASSSPRTISTSAAPAISWAKNSPATSRRSASSSTSRCWKRRWRASRPASPRRSPRSGRRRSPSARR